MYKSLTGMPFCASRAVFKESLTPHTCPYKRRTLILAAVKFSSRHYATHRDPPIYQQPGSVGSSSLLSQALDQKERDFRRDDSVGPFQLGLSRPSFDNGTAKKWSELSPKDKGLCPGSVIVVMNFLRDLQYHFSYTSDCSYDQFDSHPVRGWSDGRPYLRLDVGTLLKELSYRVI